MCGIGTIRHVFSRIAFKRPPCKAQTVTLLTDSTDDNRLEMLLEDKSAIVYGGGKVGCAVACAFARDGTRVFLAGRTIAGH